MYLDNATAAAVTLGHTVGGDGDGDGDGGGDGDGDGDGGGDGAGVGPHAGATVVLGPAAVMIAAAAGGGGVEGPEWNTVVPVTVQLMPLLRTFVLVTKLPVTFIS